MIQSFSLTTARTTLLAITTTAMLMAGCSSPRRAPELPVSPPISQGPNLAVLNQYKIALAQHITQRNAATTSIGRPQVMLRSVVVLAFKVDRQGNVLASSVYRSNGDKRAEKIALASLRQATPLPSPPAALFGNKSEVEVLEGWLFNDDGRFQLSTIAAPQLRYSLNRR